MTINLSTITFTEQDDIVPLDEEEDIYNDGNDGIINTLAGNDLIIGTSDFTTQGSGISNGGSIYSGDGDDIIIGINDDSTSGAYHVGIYNRASIDTGNGNDIITGISYSEIGAGIENQYSTINTGDGNDVITGIIPSIGTGINSEYSIINTDDGNDAITGTGGSGGIRIGAGGLDTGKDNDIITGTGFWYGISLGSFFNTGALDSFLNTGDGNDTITGNSTAYNVGIYNGGIIDTGEGDDIITGTNIDRVAGNSYPATALFNEGTINTGNGADSLISNGKLWNTGEVFSGEGNDSIIADGGFESGSSGIMFLGKGEDYIKGFGSGNFNGGNGNDILELTSGIYTFWTSPAGEIFVKDGITMNTVGFEKLIAGSASYDFTSLSEGQTIIVV